MSAAADHPADERIVEYVAGTLPSGERAAFADELAADPALASRVRGWEDALAPIAESVPPVEPSTGMWLRIAASLGAVVPRPAGGPDPAALAALRRSRGFWRGLAAGAGAVAAALAVFVAGERLLPQAPKPGLVAVVNRSGELPALIIRVDQQAGTVQVRSLATETPAGHSLELWSIVGREKPRSLGLIAPGATRVAIPESDRARLDGATLAVTVEPAGGTGDKGPTGPVVYSGKLVPERE